MNTKLHFSSVSAEWETPKELFNLLNEEFKFTLDPCCTTENHTCKRFYTKDSDGLQQSWAGERVFMNPPYGRVITKWMEKAYKESLHGDTTVVCLVPSRTDTKWFHSFSAHGKIRFLKGRLKFVNRAFPSWRADGNFKVTAAPFPSMIVIFNDSKLSTRYSPMAERFPYLECEF